MYSVYKREFQVRHFMTPWSSTPHLFMGDLLVVYGHTQFKPVAWLWAKLKRAKWCEGFVFAGTPAPKKMGFWLWLRMLPATLRIRYLNWRINRRFRDFIEEQ